MELLRAAVLISGRGSNLKALIRAADDPGFPVNIVMVVSNVPDARGLSHAIKACIPNVVIDHRNYADRVDFEAALDLELRAAGTEMICLAGFMRILTANFVTAWPDQILNIHPSLLPAFKGLHTHKRVLETGVPLTGCTVHFVCPSIDAGPILAQAVVPVLPGDTLDLLAERVLKAEHYLYPLALRLVATGRACVRGNIVEIGGIPTSPQLLFNPGVFEIKARLT